MLSRQNTIETLMRLRSGHIPTNKYKFLMGIANTPNCPDCNNVEDVYHIMTECVRSAAVLTGRIRHLAQQNLSHVDDNDRDCGVCATCVVQLRDACAFRQQVLTCEELFLSAKLQYKDPEESKAAKSLLDIDFKVEPKDDCSDHNSICMDAAVMDDELTNAVDEQDWCIDETKPSKHEEQEPKPELPVEEDTKMVIAEDSDWSASTSDSEEEVKKQKAGTPAKNRRNIKINTEANSLINLNIENVSTFRDKAITYEEIKKHKINLKEILLGSNATPIGPCGDKGYKCCYCNDRFKEPANLKKHTIESHPNYTDITYEKKYRTDKYFIRLDITALLCIICEQNIESIELMLEHLKKKHHKTIYTDINNHMIPFKFNTDTLQCCICSKPYHKFKILQEHMHTHYRNYVCDVCDSGYYNRCSLTAHKMTHVKGIFVCQYCTKTFVNKNTKIAHEKTKHSVKLYRCAYCNESFNDFRKKQVHLINLHGLISTAKCKVCNRVFADSHTLNAHVKSVHLMFRPHKCSECDMAFCSKADLKLHFVKHTRERNYKCTVCLKLFSREWTLKEHMKIHNDIRRFKCEHCGRAYIQKCSWKGHLKSKHGYEFV